MNKKSLAITSAAALAAFGLSTFATPAFAVNPALTSFAVNPATYRSGDPVTFTANGQSSGDFSFIGCERMTMNGLPMYSNDISDLDYVTAGVAAPFVPNYFAEPITVQAVGYAGASCSDPVSGSPTWDSGVLTITPQVEIDPIALKIGEPVAAVHPYTDASATGASPFDWSSGGAFIPQDDTACGINPLNGDGPSLPEGVSFDGAPSANGEAPDFLLEGTPAAGSAGEYKSCFLLTDGSAAFPVWATITVTEPALPATGADASALALAALGAVAVVGTGIGLVVRRRSAL